MVDMYCFISEQQNIRRYDMKDLIWSERGVVVGGPDGAPRNHTYTYEPSTVSLCFVRPAADHNL